ncbi:MAG: type II toxin-antitoxin system Phd/YefM family antitoxin [Gemmatimonadales bacterium]
MRTTYSLYEAKARLSALVRRVREGGHVVITVHGKPAAELRPIEIAEGAEARFDRLETEGVIERPNRAELDLQKVLKPIARRPGALRRFLDERD